MPALTRYQAATGLTASALGRFAYNNRESISNAASKIGKRLGEMAKSYSRKRRKVAPTHSKKSRPRPAPKNTYTTFQKDHTVVYSKTRKPKSKGLAAFKRKVRAVEAETRGTHEYIINGGFTVQVVGETVNPADQAASEIHLFPYEGTASPVDSLPRNDMTLMLDDADTLYKNYNPDGFEGLSTDPSSWQINRAKLNFTSAHIELTWNNQGTVPVEFDVYTITYPRQATDTYLSFLSAFLNGTNFHQPIDQLVSATSPRTLPLGVVPTLGNRGVTLFDIPKGISLVGGKINKVERFVISPGQIITKSHREARSRSLKVDNATTDTFQKSKWTTSFITLYRSHGGTENVPIRHRATKSYRYNIEGVTTPKVSFVNYNV